MKRGFFQKINHSGGFVFSKDFLVYFKAAILNTFLRNSFTTANTKKQTIY